MESKKENKKADNIKAIRDKYRFSGLDALSNAELKNSWKDIFKELEQLEKENVKLVHRNECLQIENDLLNGKCEDFRYAGYKTDWVGTEKIVFILKRCGKLMLTKEFEKEILILEPTLKQKWVNSYNSVAQIVYKAVKLGLIIQYNKIGNYGFTHALPEWFNENKLISKYSQ